MESEIFELALSMVGESLEQERENVLESMCAAAEQELMSRLKTGVLPEDAGESFIRAAAALGVSMYILTQCAAPVESFSAGSLSVKRRSGEGAQAAAFVLRRQAEMMLAGFIKDSGFDFRAVRG